MKMYCLQPFSYGPDSYFVMAASPKEALGAIYAFQGAPGSESYRFAHNRQDFDEYVRTQYELTEMGAGQVAVNANA